MRFIISNPHTFRYGICNKVGGDKAVNKCYLIHRKEYIISPIVNNNSI